MSVLAAFLNSKVVAVRVAGSMAWLKVAVTAVVATTPVAPLAGVLVVTLSGEAATVVKLQVKLAARAFPARSLIRGSVVPPRSVAVYTVELAKAAEGVRVAVRVAEL